MPSLYLQLWLCRMRLNIVTNAFIGILKRVMFIEKNIPVVKIAWAITPPYIKTRVWHDRHPETRPNLRWQTEDKSKKSFWSSLPQPLLVVALDGQEGWIGRGESDCPASPPCCIQNIVYCFLNKIFNNTQSDCPASPPCWIQNQASGF